MDEPGRSAMRDGSAPAALAGSEPVRLFLSGGGHRAALGGVGAIGALHRAGRWPDVAEVVSVSGGSLVNGALLALREEDDPADDPLPALGRFVERSVRDRMGLLATPKRVGLAVGISAVVVTLALAMAITVGLVGPDGWWRSGWAALVVGLLAVPVVVSVGRPLASAMWADSVDAVTGGRNIALAGSDEARRHLFCASGLSSGVPYYFWTRGREPVIAWGEPIQAGYTVSDAVVASSSLPTMAGVRAPTAFRREGLVDGGLSGIFGEQVESKLERDPEDTWRGEHQRLALDGGRHAVSDRPVAQGFGRLSVIYTVVRWLKASLEATYVNDLADWKDTELVRLCAAPTASAAVVGDEAVVRGLARGQERTARIGLFDLDDDAADAAIVVGYVGTARALAPALTGEEVEAGLADVGERLGRGDRLVATWRHLLSAD